ncbi:hypothetical protein KIL84_010177 [Mauremys mutica]|uniref:Uncharacterized protein n=1 Tax=Mauremys mutica TaxID=74926 RepID=A0A9D3XNC4_9SAUR|nr:hypothetical protein KIL84_010177 [Mauremys mutica]
MRQVMPLLRGSTISISLECSARSTGHPPIGEAQGEARPANSRASGILKALEKAAAADPSSTLEPRESELGSSLHRVTNTWDKIPGETTEAMRINELERQPGSSCQRQQLQGLQPRRKVRRREHIGPDPCACSWSSCVHLSTPHSATRGWRPAPALLGGLQSRLLLGEVASAPRAVFANPCLEWGLRGEAGSGITHKQPSNRGGHSPGVKSGRKVPGLSQTGPF